MITEHTQSYIRLISVRIQKDRVYYGLLSGPVLLLLLRWWMRPPFTRTHTPLVHGVTAVHCGVCVRKRLSKVKRINDSAITAFALLFGKLLYRSISHESDTTKKGQTKCKYIYCIHTTILSSIGEDGQSRARSLAQ